MTIEPRVLVFDLETKKLHHEVGGWHNKHLMGISIAVIYDSIEDDFFVYTEDTVDDLLVHLGNADLIIGFNLNNFDYEVLGAYTNDNLYALPTFDMLEDVTSRLGHRLELDQLAQETLGHGKTADGVLAVEWFNAGNFKDLIEYCVQDVAATRDLLLYGIEHSHLVFRDRSGDVREVSVNWNLSDLIPQLS